MAVEITPSVAKNLPMMVKSALSKMPPEAQVMFEQEYQKKAKSSGLMVFLAIVFPIQLFLLGKTGLGIAFWLTMGLGGIWYIIEWFLTPKRVREYNEDMATKILTEMKIMNA